MTSPPTSSCIGSAASFDFTRDFGRFFTAGTFFGLATLASMPGNTQLAAAQLAFASMAVATVTMPNGTNVNLTPGHLFGIVMNDIPFHNWLNTRLAAILNQSEIRTMASRPNAGRIPMFAIPTQNFDAVNPYTFMMSVCDDNMDVLSSWIRNMSDFVRETFPTARPLRQYTQVGPTEIFRHLVFEAPPPTWHSETLGPIVTNPPVADNQNPFRPANPRQTHQQFAAVRNFRQRAGLPAPQLPAAPAPPGLLVTAARPAAVANTWHASLVMSAAAPNNNDPIARRRLTADGQFACTPQCVIFEPTSAADATAHHVAVLTSGKIIESGDITATVIPTAHPRRNLFSQNTHYLSGAIPRRNIRSSVTNDNFDIHQVTDEDLLRSPIGIIRGYFSRLRIPRFRQGVVEQAATTPGTNSSRTSSGAVVVANSHRALDSTNVFLAPDNHTMFLPDETFAIWTSYRHFHPDAQAWYWLPSLRHIFGTQSRTFRSDHPSIAS
ncbi:capsid protein [Betapartitivirus sp.]|nr:capsid protein [Betapartitivirus sp.]